MNRKMTAALLTAAALFAALLGGCADNTPTNIVGNAYPDKEVGFQLDMPAAGDTVAILHTNKGDISIRFFPEAAPKAVQNFTTHAKNGFYDGVIFHRVIPGFMIQGGDPTGTGSGGPGYVIKGEFTKNGFKNNLKHERGVLSMALTMMPNSAGSQFFIMHEDSPHLDGQYASFGKVIEGIEVVDEIANTRTDYSDRPLEEQKIAKAEVETFGTEYPTPEKYR